MTDLFDAYPSSTKGYLVEWSTLQKIILDTPCVSQKTKDRILSVIDKERGGADFIDALQVSLVLYELVDEFETKPQSTFEFRLIVGRVNNLDLVPIVVSPQDTSRPS